MKTFKGASETSIVGWSAALNTLIMEINDTLHHLLSYRSGYKISIEARYIMDLVTKVGNENEVLSSFMNRTKVIGPP